MNTIKAYSINSINKKISLSLVLHCTIHHIYILLSIHSKYYKYVEVVEIEDSLTFDISLIDL